MLPCKFLRSSNAPRPSHSSDTTTLVEGKEWPTKCVEAKMGRNVM